MKDDPDFDPSYSYTPSSEDGDYFNRQKSSNGGNRRKLTIGVSFSLIDFKRKIRITKLLLYFLGKQIAIIISSIIGGVILIGLCLGLIFFLCHKKKGTIINFIL